MRLRDSKRSWLKPLKFSILSIDGGGIRGIMSAMIIAELEKKAKARNSLYGNAASLFDTMGGTSTGGILVAGLSLPEYEGSNKPKYSAIDMIKLYELEGEKIFQKY
jgi:patatin-like phospholipase/acyl hydrolase